MTMDGTYGRECDDMIEANWTCDSETEQDKPSNENKEKQGETAWCDEVKKKQEKKT